MTARHRCPEPALTPELLAQALRRIRRPGWPDDLATALADRVQGALVRAMARCLQRQQARMTTPPAPLPPALRWRGPLFDARRAAANDLDD